MIATALIVDWLFQVVPLRKIYLDVYGYNPCGLAEEGRLKRSRFWGGSYWDLHIFALYREGWPDLRERLLRVSSLGRPAARPADGKEVRNRRGCVPNHDRLGVTG